MRKIAIMIFILGIICSSIGLFFLAHTIAKNKFYNSLKLVSGDCPEFSNNLCEPHQSQDSAKTIKELTCCVEYKNIEIGTQSIKYLVPFGGVFLLLGIILMASGRAQIKILRNKNL